MTANNNISPMQSDFERIKKNTEDGQEYWTSRELYVAIGYSTYQKFSRVISKAIEMAKSKGLDVNGHFNQTVEMVRLGSGTFRKVESPYYSHIYELNN